MRKGYALIAVLLAAALLLSGCDMTFLDKYLIQDEGDEPLRGVTKFSDMEYTRPDMEEFQTLLDDVCSYAKTARDPEKVVERVYKVYDAYDSFYTNYHLSNIRYSMDLTDTYWETEYNYCAEQAAKADAGLDSMFYALADARCREQLEDEKYFGEGYFDAYEGESLWDETFSELMNREAELQSQYYALSGEALDADYYSEEYFTTYGAQMESLFVELVGLRQQIAAYAGYDSYPEFAYAFYHNRDYTPAQAVTYLENIGNQMSELYERVNGSNVWSLIQKSCTERQAYAYVETVAEQMGGDIMEAFRLLDSAGLYDISYSPNKYNSSFEVFLTTYNEPFIFMNPYGDQEDKLTFVHEFGHFCNDYLCRGSYAGMDVAEIHSQAMEYLSLCYGTDTEDLEKYKMADCLTVYVEQAAYALFEHQVYSLTGDDLTVENVRALYETIGSSFGFESWAWDSRDYVTITHLFTQPLYLISYVVSNDVAFQLYELEKDTPGKGLETYRECLKSEDSYVQDFVQAYGLESPLADGRVERVAADLKAILSDVI